MKASLKILSIIQHLKILRKYFLGRDAAHLRRLPPLCHQLRLHKPNHVRQVQNHVRQIQNRLRQIQSHLRQIQNHVRQIQNQVRQIQNYVRQIM